MVHPKLNQMLNWKLLNGSHEFPGPHGGTCINEAAIVAAGFEYKKVVTSDDCPPCFCRVLAHFLLKLNDSFNTEDRQQLMQFVHRLAGSAASSDETDIRAHILRDRNNQLNKYIYKLVPDINARLEVWQKMKQQHVRYMSDFEDYQAKLKSQEDHNLGDRLSLILHYAYENHHRVCRSLLSTSFVAMESLSEFVAADHVVNVESLSDVIRDHHLKTVQLMLKVGPSTSEPDVELIQTRMNAIKEEASERAKSKVSENA